MKKVSPNGELNQLIDSMEKKRDEELIQLKEQMRAVHESLKPINLIKDTFKAVATSPDLKNRIGKTAIGIASGFLVKKVFFRNSRNPLKIISSIALQTIASGFATKNFNKIKSSRSKFFTYRTI